jgi:hypothetical protein
VQAILPMHEVDDDIAIASEGCVEHEQIAVRTADQRVVAEPAAQPVGSNAAPKSVVARAAVQDIGACPASQAVIAAGAGQQVVAVIAAQLVIVGSADQRVGARSPEEDAAARPGGEHVIACLAECMSGRSRAGGQPVVADAAIEGAFHRRDDDVVALVAMRDQRQVHGDRVVALAPEDAFACCSRVHVGARAKHLVHQCRYGVHFDGVLFP